MWPLVTYPECSPNQVDGKTYDYVVVGGGTAGCVLALRLSEDPNVSVLLLERGHVKNNLVSRMPMLSQNHWWTDTMQVQNTIRSEPIHGAYERKNYLWAVNGIGGASRLNAMLWTRGSPGNYNSWSDMGLADWTWKKVEPYFRRLENVSGPLDKSQPEVRGRGGPIHLLKPPYPFKWLPYLEEAAEKIGVSTFDDCNDPDASSCGYFTLDTAIDKCGGRVSAMSAFLSKTLVRERSRHLSVCTGTVASRFEISSNERHEHTVTGVFIRHSSPSDTTIEYLVKARREVIMTCGAMNSPQLLLLSGIGPTGKESSITRLGIPLVKELPAVGADFSDHYSVPVLLELPYKETLHLLETAMWGLWYILLWIFTGRGPVGSSTAPTALFLHTDSVDKTTMQVKASRVSQDHRVPNAELLILPVNSLERAVPGRSLFSIFPTILQPRAKGHLEITSTNPLVNPKITLPMFANEDDLKDARIAVRLSMRLAHEFQQLYPFSAPFAFAPGNELQKLYEWEKSGDAVPPAVEKPDASSPQVNKTWKDVTDDEIDDYMRRVGHTTLHFTSSCPMGTDEKTGVVNQKLLVFGFKNLRIADASVFPKVTSAHTMAPTMMVAERCADFIKATWDDAKM
ncbi:GMC oxidoreductase [Lophiostoma macrostomum CBS 122681]|uniref:GMC oxidoreductase n=1 Tax=Lophiostoma macrostomum CBS 122681 TaxID=1314788 RepID=A0A6A6T269_9PLEO|nr:GMC oxidoreductase [Lophiostoma macrostomum CBS 122681]